MKFKIFKILLIVFFISFLSCNRNSKIIDEGELVYKITYIQNEKENALVALLPKKVRIKFKGNKTAAVVEGFFGTFQLKFITSPENDKSYTLVRIYDKKLYSENHIDSINAGYTEMKLCKIKKNNDDTLTFAGLFSHEASFYCKEMSDSVIKIYYTKDLKIKNPNSNTPFKDIDGVLTKFQTKVAGIDMIFELIKIDSVFVDDTEFIVPENFKKISKQELNNLLLSFQE